MIDHIYIIDDDKWFVKLVTQTVRKNGYRTTGQLSCEDVVPKLKKSLPDLILLDVFMPDINGFDLCIEIRKTEELKDIPIIFVTATDDQETVRKCFEVGGTDYIGKPIRKYELLARIERILDLKKKNQVISEMQEENSSLKKHLLSRELEDPEAFASVVTLNPEMKLIFSYIEAIAASSRPVLVSGETGVGKEVIAGIIHKLSGRSGEVVTVNVAGLDDNLFSDTLFGHMKGAYTGAERDRPGLIEKASGGTLFLDEIGDLRPESQVKLLRLIQEREYYPLGSDERKFSDARLVIATNRDLYAAAKSGDFREDLYYRLRTHQVQIPPLRERKEDLPLLIDHFIQLAAKELDRPAPAVTASLIQTLRSYNFPGNIRELEAIIFDTVSRTQAKTLSVDLVKNLIAIAPDSDDGTSHDDVFDMASSNEFPTLREMSDNLVDQALEKSDGNQTVAAQLLGISRQALYKRLKQSK